MANMTTKSKGSKVNRAWINDHVNDPYVKLAKHEGYRARAAYKLKEIDETFHLIKPGQLVVDLGSTPGAWSQYLRRKMVVKSASHAASGDGAGNPPANQLASKLSGSIIALDLLPMDPVDGVTFILGDIREQAVLDQLEREMAGRLADMVVSDMAPNLSGIHGTDAARVEHLIELAIDFCQHHMKPQGALVAKVFHGTGYNDLVKLFKANFLVVKPVKPKASRDKSTETFLVGLGLKRV
jgi:23S rRNA (uridine2552-2'-O)-methyltransferase